MGAVVLAAALGLALTAGPDADAAPPEFLLQIPTSSPATGAGANQLDNPRDVAGDPETGHLFVSELFNSRISEYTPWGEFVKAWGWDVAPEGAPGDTASDQLEVCTSECKAGDGTGAAAGQLRQPWGIAIDGAGDVYVYENALEGEPNRRVQKFDAEGNFLLMFGGEVNKTTGEDVCTRADVEAGEVCGAGVPGGGDGEFSNPGALGTNYLAYGAATDTLFVGDVGRIQEFDTGGNFIGNIDLEGVLDGKSVNALTVDAGGNFFVAVDGEAEARKLDATGKLLDVPKFAITAPRDLAVDAEGNVYALSNTEMRKFLSTGTLDGSISSSGVNMWGLATNFCEGSESPGNVYITRFNIANSYVEVYGSGPAGCETPPTVPPEIEAQYAISVGSEEAVVRGEINPFFFTDTTYGLEYGTAPCSSGGCKAVAAETLTGKVTNSPVKTAGILLENLEPGTTYYFRFIAQSHGGGPVAGPDATFTTFAVPPAVADACANVAFRIGLGTFLPDCRAYEMVSPLDKNNADIISSHTFSTEPTTLYQSATSGDRFSYSSSRAFAEPQSAPFTSQYLASRHPLGDSEEGWQSEALAPVRTRVVKLSDFQKNQFKAFSPDLCTAWFRSDADPPVANGAILKYSNIYRRENCSPLAYEALTTAPPEDRLPVHENTNQQLSHEFQGSSADGSHGLFITHDNLVGTGAPDIGESTLLESDNAQLYEHVRGEGLRFVCILPNGNKLQETCSAGTGAIGPGEITSDRFSSVHNAISADGSRIFWTASPAVGPGQIYLRIGGSQTIAISRPISLEPARFWGAADDGSRAIFSFTAGITTKEDLYEFDLATQARQLIAEGVKGVMGMSEDASRVYFASTKALNGAGVEGQPNLYLYEAAEGGAPGTITFIATLSGADVSFSGLSPVASGPADRTSRVSPDGLHAAFESKAPLTGYDNTDVLSGQPDSEVFLYDAEEASLACLSCNPTNARPTGKEGMAATVSPWERSLYAPRALSDDGNRVFFESFEALELRDTNGVQDVYQWEAEGSGDCDSGKHTFNSDSVGCVELISSGESPRKSVFLDASAGGSDVFMTTLSSLVPHDYGLVDVYDARVDGGFPPPPVPKPPCEGEACQSPPAPPESPTPASTVIGPGNPKPNGCARGKRKVKRGGKIVCKRSKKRGNRQRRKGARR